MRFALACRRPSELSMPSPGVNNGAESLMAAMYHRHEVQASFQHILGRETQFQTSASMFGFQEGESWL